MSLKTIYSSVDKETFLSYQPKDTVVRQGKSFVVIRTRSNELVKVLF